ncbi:OLC1v1009659C1 [Oldenlandia corymbosa var. corymbosa]|uniref:OLC1v1009659C1 n=1 Tax=Oldenlandia corymbosa var. corymbosa TaxID=529605 RepID=A0AAV1DPN6_OLDCO|nr:OLC1v1009659C1 [Oldenlandia corymbosa var. corymbosa]
MDYSVPKLQRSSQMSSEFLYLDTLVNAHGAIDNSVMHQQHPRGSSTGNESSTANSRKFDSPELRPSPPLYGHSNIRIEDRGLFHMEVSPPKPAIDSGLPNDGLPEMVMAMIPESESRETVIFLLRNAMSLNGLRVVDRVEYVDVVCLALETESLHLEGLAFSTFSSFEASHPQLPPNFGAISIAASSFAGELTRPFLTSEKPKKLPDDISLKVLEGNSLSDAFRYDISSLCKKLRQMEYEEQSYLNFHGNDDIDEEDQIGHKNKGKNVVSDKGLVINMTPLRSLGRHRQPDTKEFSALYMNSDNEEEEEDEEEAAPVHHMSTEKSSGREKRSGSDVRLAVKGMFSATSSEPPSKRPRFDVTALKTPKTQTQSSGKPLKACSSKKSRRDVVSAICKFFHHAGIPVQAANSPYFHKMLEAVGHYGPDLVGPSSRVLSGRFLQDEIFTIKNYLAEYRASWAVTGCSILADSWRDTQDDGKEVEKLVLNASFWKRVQYVKKSVEPVVDVLLKINGDERLSVPFIYNCMFRAKMDIKDNHGDDARKYTPFWNVIDCHWNSLSHHPLYLAAYFLNPAYHYRADFVPHPDVMRGLTACIVRLEPDNTKRISASMQISDFDAAKADFGTDLAISTRVELDPAAWWQQHGINCLELQRIAVRILSQTCSSFGCEHSWSMFDKMYSRRHNHTAQRRLNDIIYVHYNLRLRERQIRKRSGDSIPLESILDETLLYDWIVEAEKQSIQEDEEISFSDMEHVETHENELDYEDGSAEFRKGSLEMLTVADIVDPLDITPANTFTGSDDEAEMDFLDDNLSD